MGHQFRTMDLGNDQRISKNTCSNMITVCLLYLSCGLILASGEVEAAAAAAAPVVIQVWLCWVFD